MSLTATVKTALVGHLDLSGYIEAEESISVADVLGRMRRDDRTTALITRGGSLSGIFTERDVLQKIVGRPERLPQPVKEFMTPEPRTIGPQVSILGALRVMTDGHFRDIPVIAPDGKILGNLTDNAIVRHLCDHLQAEVLNLPPDPRQIPKLSEGA